MIIDEEDVQELRDNILITMPLKDLERIMCALANQKYISMHAPDSGAQEDIDKIYLMVEAKVYDTIKRIREGYYSTSNPKYYTRKTDDGYDCGDDGIYELCGSQKGG